MTDCKCDLGNILDEETFNLRVIRELCAVDKPIRGYQFIRMVDKTDDGDVQFLRTPVGDYLLDGETPYTPIGEVSVYKRSSGPEPLINDGVFRFTIDTTLDTYSSGSSARRYVMSLPRSNNVTDFIVDWGDGTPTVVGGDDHTYATHGVYQISISAGASGEFPDFALGAAGVGSQTKIYSIDTPPPAIKGNKLEGGFRYCSNLTSVCANLFVNNPHLVNLLECFSGTTNLKTIPAGLFEIPSLEIIESIFENSGLEKVPTYLFRSQRQLWRIRYAFRNCTSLQITPDIFCDEATEMSTRFIDRANIWFGEVFKRDSCTNPNQGTAPQVWNYTFNNTNPGLNCFAGAGNNTTSLSNYSLIPLAWGGPA